jgi:ABC-type multidrug transport system fused ATPase/permease subunit
MRVPGIDPFLRAIRLLNSRERKRLRVLLVAMVFRGLIDLIGVGSIIPFMTVIGNPAAIHTNKYLSRAYELFGFSSDRSFLVALGVGAIGVIIFNSAFSALTAYATQRYSFGRRNSLSNRLLASYLSQPYAFFLSHNSSELVKNVVTEVSQVFTGILGPGIELVSRAISIAFIIALFIVVDPLLALIVTLVLGGAYGIVFAACRTTLTRIGRERVVLGKLRYQAMSEALGGAKEIKLLGVERNFLEAFAKPSRENSRLDALDEILGDLPKFFLEALAFGGIMAIVLYLLLAYKDLSSVLPLMSLYAFAGYKMLPALQISFKALAKMRSSQSSLELIEAHMALDTSPALSVEPSRERLEPKTTIRIEALRFSYESSEKVILEIPELELPARRSIGIAGPTGSGKTTFVDILIGLLSPQSGRILVDGIPLSGEAMRSWQNAIGYIQQSIYLSDDTVAANIAFGSKKANLEMDSVIRSAKAARIHEFIQSLPLGYDTIIGERGVRFSGGQRQRIGIARALYRDPPVLILDEATSALDNATERAVMDAMATYSKERTTFMIAHRLTTLQGCDTILFINKGRVEARGSYQDLLASSEGFRKMAGKTIQ